MFNSNSSNLAEDNNKCCTGISRRSVLFAPFLLSGCINKKKKLEPVEVTIWLEADDVLNLNELGESSPIVVRFYELKSPTLFEQAGFFDLFDNDTGKLGTEMLGRREIELKPGDRQRLLRKPPLDARFIGAIAGFREMTKAEWRNIIEIIPNYDNEIVARVTALSIRMERINTRRS